MSEGNFRSALNGFNRQDVAAYIADQAEKSKALRGERDGLAKKAQELEGRVEELEGKAQADAEKLSSLQSSLEERENRLASAANREAELNAALGEAEERCRKLSSQMEIYQEASKDQAAFAEELETLRSRNAVLERELSSCKEELRQVSDEAAEYAAVKERVLKLELNASRRAVEIEQNASRNATEMMERAEEQNARMKREREEMLRRFKGDFAKLSQELGFQAELLDQQLGQMVATLQETSDAMNSIAVRIEGMDEPAPEEAENEG